MWLIDDFRDFKFCKQLFSNQSVSVGNILGYTLKKDTDPCSIYYGLFDGDELVGYNWVMKFKNNMFRGHEFHIADKLQKKGIGTEMYLYLLLVDRLVFVSDRTHTTPTSNVWNHLTKNPNIEVLMYNAYSDEILPIDTDKVYNNSHMHFLARAK